MPRSCVCMTNCCHSALGAMPGYAPSKAGHVCETNTFISSAGFTASYTDPKGWMRTVGCAQAHAQCQSEAPGVATRALHATASSQPPPRAIVESAATVGLGPVSTRSRKPMFTFALKFLSAPPDMNWLISNPPLKVPLAPVMTIALTCGLPCAFFKFSKSSWITALLRYTSVLYTKQEQVNYAARCINDLTCWMECVHFSVLESDDGHAIRAHFHVRSKTHDVVEILDITDHSLNSRQEARSGDTERPTCPD